MSSRFRIIQGGNEDSEVKASVPITSYCFLRTICRLGCSTFGYLLNLKVKTLYRDGDFLSGVFHIFRVSNVWVLGMD